MQIDEVRTFALTLPGATEAPHHELWSFRVNDKIFATYPGDGLRVHVFVDEAQTAAVVAAHPAAAEELWWGRKLAGVRLRLDVAPDALVRSVLVDAWRRKAPRRVVAVYDAAQQ
ncbi:MAG: MmcQ/YjbR family DNA-binding protein [Pseudomonadota bacterium]|nr:MmcQ/YjbR family DNA-binding protein [Pseudomonadota bacterium]